MQHAPLAYDTSRVFIKALLRPCWSYHQIILKSKLSCSLESLNRGRGSSIQHPNIIWWDQVGGDAQLQNQARKLLPPVWDQRVWGSRGDAPHEWTDDDERVRDGVARASSVGGMSVLRR